MQRHLPRLEQSQYLGMSGVHWNFTTEARKRGWLNDLVHARFREILLHAAVRYQMVCPMYCLMPDHMHLLLLGVDSASDQLGAIKFLRRHINAVLAASQTELQKQAYDHRLRENESGRSAFQAIAWYVAENPVRAGLVKEARDWPYTGCMVVGHPSWDVFHTQYWDSFWLEHNRMCMG
jgi:REP element-mobilizing transposase RayT